MGAFDTPVLVLFAALLIDWLWGEVPAAVHPVVAMGTIISWAEKRMPAVGSTRQILAGGLLALAFPGGLFAATYYGLQALSPWPLVQGTIQALLLTTCFAIRELRTAARRVGTALQADDLPRARFELRSLCSRNASELSAPQIATATVESIAENASDSIAAPLFYFALLGIPGAVLYRAANTLDAMLGYRDHRLYTGKVSARLDDLLNIIPARLTAVLFLFVGAALRLNALHGWRIWRRDARKTDSPNAGHPMAAMAGLLGVRLDKPGQYRLGDDTQQVDAATIGSSWAVVQLATAAGIGLLVSCLS